MSLPSRGHLRDRLDETTAGGGNLGERALQPGPRDSAAAMALSTKMQVIRQRARGGGSFAYSRWCLSPGFLRRAVLAPALREVVLVEDERGVRAARP